MVVRSCPSPSMAAPAGAPPRASAGGRGAARGVVLAAALAALAALLPACGVGPVEESGFLYGTMGPEGGVVAVSGLTLRSPRGARRAHRGGGVPGGADPPGRRASPGRVHLRRDRPGLVLRAPRAGAGGGRVAAGAYGDAGRSPSTSTRTDLVLLLWDATVSPRSSPRGPRRPTIRSPTASTSPPTARSATSPSVGGTARRLRPRCP